MHLKMEADHILVAKILLKYGASLSTTSRADFSSADRHSGQVNIVTSLSKIKAVVWLIYHCYSKF